MKLLSEAVESGLRAVIWLAKNPQQSFKVKEIADGIGAAPGYLIKVLQGLSRHGIVHAKRGSQGGFTLSRDPNTLTALEVINAVDPIERITKCPLNLSEHHQRLCGLHQRIDDGLAWLETSFDSTTITQLLSFSSEDHPVCDFTCDQSGAQTDQM